MRDLLKKIYIKFFSRTPKQRVKYLIKNGAKIGKNVIINTDVISFCPEPYLIEIGENCFFSKEASLMTHDGGVFVLKNLGILDKKMDKLGKIKIGNNVFVGMNAVVMPGITIGDNVIIGLGSIVTKDIESNSVVCGIPAKKICTLDEYKTNINNKLYPTSGMSQKDKRAFLEKNV